MKLLLDEHFPPVVARELRERGRDVVAVKERPELCGLADPELLEFACAEGRALVSENVRDFAPLHETLLQDGRGHPGLVFTSDRRFPRGRSSTVGALVNALDALCVQLEEETPAPGWVWWL